MSVANVFDAAVPPHPSVEDVYAGNYQLLLRISVGRFRVPHGDAEALINDVFVSYMASEHEVRDARAFLVGAICNASRHYWRTHSRTEPLPEDFTSLADPSTLASLDAMTNSITIRQTIGRLHEKCRKTLRLKFWDGQSAAELAASLETTDRYAEKLIHKCVARARKILRMLTANQGDVS